MGMLDEARELDRRLNATRDPEEMKALISRRRLVRAGLDFDHAMAQLEADNPVPAEIPDPFPFRPGSDPVPPEEHERVVRELNRLRHAETGVALCRRCGAMLDLPGDRVAHAGWCLGCSSYWVEQRILRPLIRRLGEREARKALARLVRSAKRRRSGE